MNETEQHAHRLALAVLLRSVSDTHEGEFDRVGAVYKHVHALWRDAEPGSDAHAKLTTMLVRATSMDRALRDIEARR